MRVCFVLNKYTGGIGEEIASKWFETILKSFCCRLT